MRNLGQRSYRLGRRDWARPRARIPSQDLVMKSVVMSVLVLAAVVAGCVAAASDLPADPVLFPRAFAPAEGLVARPEREHRDELCLNGQWRFQPVSLPAGWQPDHGTPPDWSPPGAIWEAVPIRIPSPWNANTWGCGRGVGSGTEHPLWPDSVCFPSYPTSWDGVQMGWLERSVHIPASWAGKRILLHCEAVAGDCRVLINRQLAGEHHDRFLPFELDITELVHLGSDNEVLVGVRHGRLSDQTDPRYPHYRSTIAPGSTLDGIVGIWQDVTLLAVPPLRTTELFVQPWLDRDQLAVQATVRNDTDADQEVSLAGQVSPWVSDAGTDVLSAPEPAWHLAPPVLSLPATTAHITAHTSATVQLTVAVGHTLATWTPAAPHLYGLVVTTSGQGRVQDAAYQRFGWRQFRIVGAQLQLNGAPFQVMADILHPFGVFIQTRRHAWAWFRMIKDIGGNGVRLHAQPWPRCYEDLADEMGIVVLAESGLFGSSLSLNFGQASAWQHFSEHIHDLVLRDRNHPSVFGWSIGNELFAISEYNHLSDQDAASAYAQLAGLGRSVATLDPTRPWISCDGDEDLRGTLPVWAKHFGHGLALDRLPTLAKPLMVGESGGTYYATPGQLAQFNGERAYESYAGRNEALAIDVYQNIVAMARPRLSYFSASELAWFGLEQLPFGYHDHTRLPTLHDGVVFRPYVEGVPGVQPERLPPYCSTFNPGYDPTLPLYRPLAMFTAMRAALASAGPQPCPWDHQSAPPAPPPAAPPPTISAVGFLGDRHGELYQALASDGVPFVENGAQAGLLVVDVQSLNADQVLAAKPQVEALLARGGLVLVSFRQPSAAIAAVNRLLPLSVSLTPRTATSLTRGSTHPWTAGWSLADLYFAENPSQSGIIACGLAGGCVNQGKVLLSAASADWSLFNNVGEVAKCAAMVMDEQLIKPSGAALVAMPCQAGTIAVTTIDPLPRERHYVEFWRTLFTRMGVQMQPPACRWYVPIATVEPMRWHFTIVQPAAGWNQVGFDDQGWAVGEAGFGTAVPASRVRTPWTSDDIWLRTGFEARAVPNGPLHLIVHHDEDVEVYLNGERIFSEAGFLVAYKDITLSEHIGSLVHTGRNQLSVHCHQTVGGQYIDVGLACGLVLLGDAGAHAHDLLLNGPTN